MQKSTIVLLISVLCLASFTSLQSADIPQLIQYQGRLTDNTGVAVNDGEYEMEFAVYYSPNGGSPAWTSGDQLVTVVDGLFSYQIPIPPAILASASHPYLSVSVEGDEITPRSQLVSVPYAYYAESGGGWTHSGLGVLLSQSTDNVGIGATNPTAKLEVSYILRLTPTDAPGYCTSDLQGGVYFDQVLNEPCFCDGEYWYQFDGGGLCSNQCVDYDYDGYDVCDPSNPNDTDGLQADCNDSDASVNPGATEICDLVDNNCDGQIDEGVCHNVEVGDLLITEIMLDGYSQGSGGYLWFEIRNVTQYPLNLIGLRLEADATGNPTSPFAFNWSKYAFAAG